MKPAKIKREIRCLNGVDDLDITIMGEHRDKIVIDVCLCDDFDDFGLIVRKIKNDIVPLGISVKVNVKQFFTI